MMQLSIQEIEIPNETKVFDDQEKKQDLISYFQTEINPNSPDDFDELAIPVLAFLNEDVNILKQGVYSNSEEKAEMVGERNKPIYRAIKTEFFKFICTEEPYYKSERIKISKIFDDAVVVIAAAIAGLTGLAVGIVGAVVAIMLKIAIRIGVKSWCATLT